MGQVACLLCLALSQPSAHACADILGLPTSGAPPKSRSLPTYDFVELHLAPAARQKDTRKLRRVASNHFEGTNFALPVTAAMKVNVRKCFSARDQAWIAIALDQSKQAFSVFGRGRNRDANASFRIDGMQGNRLHGDRGFNDGRTARLRVGRRANGRAGCGVHCPEIPGNRRRSVSQARADRAAISDDEGTLLSHSRTADVLLA